MVRFLRVMKFQRANSDLFLKYLGEQQADEYKDAAGIAAADQCRYLSLCFTVSRQYPPVWTCVLDLFKFLFLGVRAGPPRRGGS